MKTVAFSIIEAAKQQDHEAVEFIRRHFESYIASQCLITFVDQYGNMKSFVDDELRYCTISRIIWGSRLARVMIRFHCHRFTLLFAINIEY